jgi:hypothetical protein
MKRADLSHADRRSECNVTVKTRFSNIFIMLWRANRAYKIAFLCVSPYDSNCERCISGAKRDVITISNGHMWHGT